MRFSTYALVPAFVAALASAAWDHPWQQPVGDNPSGNPISAPGLNQIVPVGTPFTITWAPTTTTDFVDIVLLRGPRCVWRSPLQATDSLDHYSLPFACPKTNMPNSLLAAQMSFHFMP